MIDDIYDPIFQATVGKGIQDVQDSDVARHESPCLPGEPQPEH